METKYSVLLKKICNSIGKELQITSSLNSQFEPILNALPKPKREKMLAFKESYLYNLNYAMISKIFSNIKNLKISFDEETSTINDEAEKRMEEIIEMNYNAMQNSEKTSIKSKTIAIDRMRETIISKKY